MLRAGLDLSRKKLDICLLCDRGEHVTSSPFHLTSIH